MTENATGNLLEAEADALVNTVNCVGAMGKGIALQFKQAFPAMNKAYEAACRRKEVIPGEMHVWQSDQPLALPKYVINFPTKRHWRGKSRMADIEAGLDALVDTVERLGIESIAVPPLGCGHGGLDWGEVRPRIEAAFEKLPRVRVLLYAPAGAPAAKARVVNTLKPEMNATRAVLLAGLRQYLSLGYSLTLLEIQKVAYFLQEAGGLHQLRYKKQTYGPYADNLNFVLQNLNGHYLDGYDGDRSPDKEISVLEAGVEQSEAFLDANETGRAALNRVSELIEGFETPYGMELLSSVHYVAVNDSESAKTADEAVEAVHAWNGRKRSLLSSKHIHVAWNRLLERGWVASEQASGQAR